MNAKNERGLLRALAGMHSEVSRFIWAILDNSVSVQDEIDFGNALVRGGRALVRDGKRRLEVEADAASGRQPEVVEPPRS